MKNLKDKNIVFGGVAVIILIAIGWYTFNEVAVRGVSENSEVTIEEGGITFTTKGGGGATIEILPIVDIPQPIPGLKRKLTFPQNYPQAAKDILAQGILELTGALKKDPASPQKWIELGLIYKTIGDHKGAEEAWIYAGRLNPEHYLPLANLADLYAYYLKDSTKAEENYLKAIEKGPDQQYIKDQFEEFKKLLQ